MVTEFVAHSVIPEVVDEEPREELHGLHGDLVGLGADAVATQGVHHLGKAYMEQRQQKLMVAARVANFAPEYS